MKYWMPPPRAWLPSGTQIICDRNGCTICETNQAVLTDGSVSNIGVYHKWQVRPPHVGQTFNQIQCHCGGNWIRSHGAFGGQVHTKRGWWPR